MTEPIESLILDVSKTQEPSLRAAQGATVLEYETTIPTKFMIGTEQGTVISCNRKGKTQTEKIAAVYQAHLGQVKQVRLGLHGSVLETVSPHIGIAAAASVDFDCCHSLVS